MAFEPGNQHGKVRKGNKLSGMAREHTEKALKVIIDCLDDDKAETRLKAAELLHNRGWGKAQEFIEISGDEENPIRQKITIELIKSNANPGSV